MKKLFKYLFCLFLIIGLVGCDKFKEEKNTEKTLLDKGYYIEATDFAVAISIKYENTNKYIYWLYNTYTDGDIHFKDELFLKDDEIKINSENGELQYISGKIKLTQDDLKGVKKHIDNELDRVGLNYSQLKRYMEYKMNEDPESVGESSRGTIKEIPKQIFSDTRKYYIIATTLTKYDLDKKSYSFANYYSYNGLDLTSDDCEFIDASYNFKGEVNQGAIYRKLATLLEGYNAGFNNGSDISKFALGFETSSTEEFNPYYNNLSTFIVTKNPLQAIMKKFEKLESINGSFDHTNKKYDFTINSTTDCAKEMGISEECLGYILAMLDEYAPDISFSENSCTFKLNI